MNSSDPFVYNLPEVSLLAKNVLADLVPDSVLATILALRGDLGTGKTTFTQFLAGELGVKEQITSPTFVIEKKYLCAPDQKFKNLIHIDCYRLHNAEEIVRLDWTEIINNPNNLIVIEWPERIEQILPTGTVQMDFEFVDESQRRIVVKK